MGKYTVTKGDDGKYKLAKKKPEEKSDKGKTDDNPMAALLAKKVEETKDCK